MSKKIEYSESGQPIYRYENVENEWEPPVYGNEELDTKIEEHVTKFLGKSDTVLHEIVSDLIHLDVYHIKPTKERNYHTFITRGMSFLPMDAPKGCEDWRYSELMVCLPPDWPISQEDFKEGRNYWPIWLMKMLARFPHKYKTWISWGHTIPNGDPAEPYADNTKLCCALLLPPIDVNTDFISLKVNDDVTVKFLSVVPIYKEEMEYKLKYGVEALMDKFDKYNINEVIDIKRRNVCKQSIWPFNR